MSLPEVFFFFFFCNGLRWSARSALKNKIYISTLSSVKTNLSETDLALNEV